MVVVSSAAKNAYLFGEARRRSSTRGWPPAGSGLRPPGATPPAAPAHRPSVGEASTWAEYRPLRSAEWALNHSSAIANTYGITVTAPMTRYERCCRTPRGSGARRCVGLGLPAIARCTRARPCRSRRPRLGGRRPGGIGRSPDIEVGSQSFSERGMMLIERFPPAGLLMLRIVEPDSVLRAPGRGESATVRNASNPWGIRAWVTRTRQQRRIRSAGISLSPIRRPTRVGRNGFPGSWKRPGIGFSCRRGTWCRAHTGQHRCRMESNPRSVLSQFYREPTLTPYSARLNGKPHGEAIHAVPGES